MSEDTKVRKELRIRESTLRLTEQAAEAEGEDWSEWMIRAARSAAEARLGLRIGATLRRTRSKRRSESA